MVRRFVRLLFYLLAGLLVWGIGTAVAQSQWIPVRPIPEYNDRRPPVMVVDSAGTVHAFNSGRIPDSEDTAVYYRTWTLADSWSSPVDIMLSPESGPIRVQDVEIDENNQLHMLFFAGNPPQTGNIYYTTAPVWQAGNARAWSAPVIVGADAGPLSVAELARDERGRMVALYGGQGDGIGLYAVQSLDNGRSWSAPTILSLVNDADRWPSVIQTAWDEVGELHVVWSVANERALGVEVLYARLDGALAQWSLPMLLAERQGSDYAANWPSIVAHEGKLFVLYMDDFPPTRFVRISEDWGRTWSEPIRPFPHIGEYGGAVFLHDGDGRLHLILGNRIPVTETHGMWHSVWQGDHWSLLEPVVSGPKTNTFDPSAPRAVMANGNVLLAAWWHDAPDAELPDFSYAIMDAQGIEPVPVQTPTPEATAVGSVNSATAVAIPANLPALSDSGLAVNVETTSPDRTLAMGVLPVLVIIALLVMGVVWRQKRRM